MAQGTRKRVVLDTLIMLPLEIGKMVVEYCPVRYASMPIHSWELINGDHTGIILEDEHLYVADCNSNKSCIQIYTLKGERIETTNKFPTLERAGDIDLDENGIYFIDKECVYIYTRAPTLKLVSSFELTPHSDDNYNHLKVDQNRIFVTIELTNDSFFIYTKEGKVEKKIGEKGSGSNQLFEPRGLAIEKENLYICDFGNNRIQVVLKDEPYTFVRRWGGSAIFEDPYCIRISEGIAYVGDLFSVQLFICEDGELLQRLGSDSRSNEVGEFERPWGMWVDQNKNLLYITEKGSQRIQVFEHC